MQPLSTDGLPDPQVLFCGLSSPEHYPRPLFSNRELFCGPDCQTITDAGGFVSIATPPGDFDMAALVAQLPVQQKPDLIVVKADATRRNLARNLARIPCPKLLLVGDTHHLTAPIQTLIQYATAEPFDAIVLDHTRHHGHFFVEAGFDRVYWIPALDYALRRRAIPPTPAYSHALTFVGQIGAFHPYRRHVLAEVARAGLPLQTLRGTPEETADLYAASAITLNCSLNGDLNLRVFEALGAGGFLITDALSPESGLERLFTPGRHLVTYRSPGELVELIRHYLDHPDEAQAIRAAGQAHLLATQSPARKRAQLYSLLDGGGIDPELVVSARPLPSPLPPRSHAFRHRLAAYEAVQHLHRGATRLSVLAEPDDPLGLAGAVADLPRVVVETDSRVQEGPPLPPTGAGEAIGAVTVAILPWAADLAAAEAAVDRRLSGSAAGFVVSGGSSWTVRAAAGDRLAAWGFSPVEAVAGLYQCTDQARFTARSVELAQRGACAAAPARVGALVEAAASPDQAWTAARLAQALGDGGHLERALQRCVALDRNHDDGLRAWAALADANGRPGDAWILTAERLRTRGLPLDASATLPDAPALESLERRAADDPRLARYRALVTVAPAPAAVTRRILVITNLFPPQEFGGYGRKLWEFSAELLRRGHDVRILSADVPELARPGMAGTADLEGRVERSLELHGYWRDGRAFNHDDRARCVAVLRANVARILEAVRRHGSEACLVGNLDLVGAHCLGPLTQQGIPVVHCLGNQHPGYSPEEAPRSPLYRPGPASRWVDERLRESGYGFAETSILYPGARVDYFYRPVLPQRDRLRIAFASLYVVYKGPQVLLNALNLLHHAGIDFECVMAGEAPDAALLEQSRAFCERTGLAGKVRFQGFLDRRGMAALFARSNVLVFPSVFQEPFGISQVEAMAAGLTVVTSATGGSGEIVRHGVDGLHFASENHMDLAAKLRGLLEDRNGWARLAEAGRARAFDFAVSRSVDRIEKLFTDLLSQHRRSGS